MEAAEAILVRVASVTILVKYRVEMYRGGGENDDETSRTRYTVEDLDPYTTYTSELEAPTLCVQEQRAGGSRLFQPDGWIANAGLRP